jgi:hypothetical protein
VSAITVVEVARANNVAVEVIRAWSVAGHLPAPNAWSGEVAVEVERLSRLRHIQLVEEFRGASREDAVFAGYWLLGPGLDRDRAGDAAARKTAEALLREHGWTLTELRRYGPDSGRAA